ncbi:MAG: long-chain-fatty-acid--CoA ligase [Desulfarculaceae bacterium]|jgi:acyl-CoA synthetase (AMP-forming)/AMP-acid ligase II
MNLLLSLNKALTLWPQREAVVEGNLRYSYQEFGQRINQLARVLRAKGLGPGEVAAIVAPNVHQYLETYYACALLGTVLNPINFRLAPRETAFILNDSGAKILLAHTDFAADMEKTVAQTKQVKHLIWIGDGDRPDCGVETCSYEETLANEKPDTTTGPYPEAGDLAHLYYTSGTTGKPKGVMLTHGNVAFHSLSAIAELNLSDADTWIHVAPLFHLADAWATFAITWVGGRHLCVPYFEAGEVLKAIQEEKVTISNMIPTMLNLLVNHPQVGEYDYSSLRVLLSGGAPIAPETVRRIVDTFGCDYIQTYGMTETSPYLTVSILKEHLKALPADKQLQTKSRTGRPFIGVELKVVRIDGSEVAKDDQEVGEIVVRGPIVTPGYWNRPQATEEAFSEGWLHTGDLAVINEEGYVNIVDRKKDMIVTGGENVYSTEVEYVLYEHPQVLECAVIGVPDQKWGEAIKAVVVPKPGTQPSQTELIEFVKERLARYKAPKSVDFVGEIPKTGSGKIYKKGLKDQYWQGKNRRVG